MCMCACEFADNYIYNLMQPFRFQMKQLPIVRIHSYT